MALAQHESTRDVAVPRAEGLAFRCSREMSDARQPKCFEQAVDALARRLAQGRTC